MQENRIKIITRKSPLALIQTEEITAAIAGLDYKVITIDSYGDKNKQISLLSDIPQDFFTRELDNAILSGKADVAVHSAKDLPLPLKTGLEVIALTKAEDSTDCLVSKNNLHLDKLPKDSKIGTSSVSRKAQLLKLRPDLKVVAIRGTVEERLSLLENGKLDALIVATCALKRLRLESRIAEILPFETHPLQGNLAVVAKNSRADLKVIFSTIDVRQSYGKVYLVGAGSGTFDLLTLKADNILKHSDVIYYDDLIDENILLRYPFADKIYVGKRKGEHYAEQDEINKLTFESVKQGKIVTRLKGGDPFIFGRGGEELKYLQERFVDVEVVPGISAFQAAGASSGIPLTMRGLSSKLTLISAHSANCETQDEAETLIYYMAASKLEKISNSLIKKGFKPNTPVAVIYRAGFIDEEITVTDLKALKTLRKVSPLIVIVGKTAALYQSRNKVLFTGLDPINSSVHGKIIHYPLIGIHPMNFTVDINKYDGIVFTSKQAVNAYLSRYSIPKGKKIISIGKHTSKELLEYGYKTDFKPSVPDSDALVELIKKLKFKRIIYPCSNLSDNRIHKLANVVTIVVYKTIPKKQQKIDLKTYSGVVFSSSSTVDAFLKIYNKIPKHLVLYVYGKHTAEKLRRKGYTLNLQ